MPGGVGCESLSPSHPKPSPITSLQTHFLSALCVSTSVCVCMCVCVCLCFSAISINHQPLCFLGKCCEYQQHERFSSDGWVHASVEKRPTQHKLLEQAKQP